MPRRVTKDTLLILANYLGPKIQGDHLMIKLLDDLDKMVDKLMKDEVPGLTYEERRISMDAAHDKQTEYFAEIGEQVVKDFRAGQSNLRR